MSARFLRSAKTRPSFRRGKRHGDRSPVSGERGRAAPRLAAEREARLAAEAECARLRADIAARSADRDHFLTAVAHDLRTPLTALWLQVQGLIAYPERNGGARLATRLRAMDRQLAHLNDLVNRLLGVAQLSGGAIHLSIEETDLAAVARDVARRFEPALAWARCPITLRAGDPVVGRWDRFHLEQVVANLLSNAVKFGAGAPIEVTVTGEGSVAKIVVRDHGIGIAAEDQDRIFARFARAEGARAFQGIGLGLWIVRQVVEASGGRISVESRPGSGATFMVDLPREPPSA
jgi:signal transduction histidine kinase